MLNDADIAAQHFRLFQVVRGQNDGGAFVVQIFQETPHGATQFNIHASGRLIKDKQLWLVHQRAGNHQAALHPSGQHPRALVTFLPQIKLFQVLFAALKRLFALHAIVTRLVNNNLLYRLKRVIVELLRHQPQLALGVDHIFLQIVAKHADAARGFIDQWTDDPDGGGFPCPVRPQKRVEISRFDFKIYPAQRLDAPRVGFFELFKLQCNRHEFNLP